MPGPLLGGRTPTAARNALFGPAGHPATPLASLVLAWRARQTGTNGLRPWSPWPLAGNRAQTPGALAYAAEESPPAARPRAELACGRELRREQSVGTY